MRVAVNEIHAVLLNKEMDVYLVVFDDRASSLGGKTYPNLEEYIDWNYVEDRNEEEYGNALFGSVVSADRETTEFLFNERRVEREKRGFSLKK